MLINYGRKFERTMQAPPSRARGELIENFCIEAGLWTGNLCIRLIGKSINITIYNKGYFERIYVRNFLCFCELKYFRKNTFYLGYFLISFFNNILAISNEKLRILCKTVSHRFLQTAAKLEFEIIFDNLLR